MQAWYPLRSEEGAGARIPGVTDCCEPSCGCWALTQVLWSLGLEPSYVGRLDPVWAPTSFTNRVGGPWKSFRPTRRLLSLRPLSVTPSGATILPPADFWSSSTKLQLHTCVSSAQDSRKAQCPCPLHIILEYGAFLLSGSQGLNQVCYPRWGQDMLASLSRSEAMKVCDLEVSGLGECRGDTV